MNDRERIYDRVLVMRFQAGEISAFEELVDRWQERLWRHAYRLLGDEAGAWDALQEGWIGIDKGIARLDDPAAFPSWAYRIVGNKCRDWIRREERRRRIEGSYTEDEVLRKEDEGVVGARVHTLKEALDRLSNEDRALLGLYYEQDLSVAAIGDILSIPAGTVKSRLYHTRKRLKSMVEELNDE